MVNKREWVLKALRNEEAGPVPAGFWFHFVPNELEDGLVDPRVIEENIRGHQKYYREIQPDFVKIMTDGFFRYPDREFQTARTAADLWKVQSIGADHPWIEKQVEFAKNLTGMFGNEVLTFYSVFSPATTFKFVRSGSDRSPDAVLADFIGEDRDAVIHALDTVAGDLALLVRRVITEGGADGIYLSAQDLSDGRIDGAVHRAVIAPADIRVLEAANAAGGHGSTAASAGAGGPVSPDAGAGGKPGRGAEAGMPLNILHICGYVGHRNDLRHFADYPAQIMNWAVVFEGLSLREGKRLFGNRPVMGGFDNTVNGLLYRGTEAEIKAETRRIIAETGKTGLILGADCTLPRDIDLRRLQWVREAAI
jgi:uroporphyrinogen decarboxylase